MPKPNRCTMALKARTNTLSAKPIQTNVRSISISVKGSAASIKTKFGSGGDVQMNRPGRSRTSMFCRALQCVHRGSPRRTAVISIWSSRAVTHGTRQKLLWALIPRTLPVIWCNRRLERSCIDLQWKILQGFKLMDHYGSFSCDGWLCGTPRSKPHGSFWSQRWWMILQNLCNASHHLTISVTFLVPSSQIWAKAAARELAKDE